MIKQQKWEFTAEFEVCDNNDKNNLFFVQYILATYDLRINCLASLMHESDQSSKYRYRCIYVCLLFSKVNDIFYCTAEANN